ncbi:MAG: DNA/RNA non-specific endonuclease [Crocinitomicaceae bacterium]|nr:DNA/RNA non-specific endonuclease [Crocinitomicaceae bacterium]
MNYQKFLIAFCSICVSFVCIGQLQNDTSYSGLDSNFSILYLPKSNGNQLIHHAGYSLSYSEQAEQAEWVYYKLTSANFNDGIKRSNDFRIDPYIFDGSADLTDYTHSGYDRGHLAPAGSMKLSVQSMSQSFFMSNMSPQIPGFNRGVWKRLEEKVRYWTGSHDSIFVATGPILDNPIDTIGPNQVIVPRAYYKTLLAFGDNKIKGIAFLLPHEASDKSLYSFAVSIDSIESITNIDFYYDLELSIQDEVESNNSVKSFLFNR